MNTSFSELYLSASYHYNSLKPLLVDVGAHHGSFSRVFARKGWRVIAFEPEKKNYTAFKRNLSKFNNVNCISKAVTDSAGDKVPFYTSDEHYGIHSLRPFHNTHQCAYKVETIRLDDALKKLNVSEVTLLKIDVEGADFPALKSFDLNKFRPELIMAEFMDDRSFPLYAYTHHDMVTYMQQFGYILLLYPNGRQ